MAVVQQNYVTWRTRWPRVIVECRTDEAVALLQLYYAADGEGKPHYTGALFEKIAAINPDPYLLGTADLIAVSMLSVNIPKRAAIRLLGPDSTTITEHLQLISTKRTLVEAHADELGPDSVADNLWNLLRNARDGLGPTRTSKLLAVKRPYLLPIWDSYVQQATGLGITGFWQRMQHVLTADEGRLWNWLGQLKAEASKLVGDLSELRVLDVLLWMSVEAHNINALTRKGARW